MGMPDHNKFVVIKGKMSFKKDTGRTIYYCISCNECVPEFSRKYKTSWIWAIYICRYFKNCVSDKYK